jgi:hypothetical protein
MNRIRLFAGILGVLPLIFLSLNTVWATSIPRSTFLKMDCTVDPIYGTGRPKDEWKDDLWDQLENSDVPWIRATRAASLFSTRHCASRDRAKEIFLNVLDDSRSSPRALSIVASSCEYKVMKKWCSDNHVFDKLSSADPDNAYAILMPLLATEKVPSIGKSRDPIGYDTPEHRALLEAASKASFYNDYAHQGAMELIPLLTDFIEESPPSINNLGYLEELAYRSQSVVVLAGQLTFWYSPASLGHLDGLCRHMVISDDQRGQNRCWEIADLLRTKGRSTYIRSEGLAIGRSMLAAIDAENILSENPDYIKFSRIDIDHDCFTPKYVGYDEFDIFKIKEPFDEEQEEALLKWLKDTDEIGQIRTSHKNGLKQCGEEFDEESFREEHGITKEDYDYPWTAPRRSYRPKPPQSSSDEID